MCKNTRKILLGTGIVIFCVCVHMLADTFPSRRAQPDGGTDAKGGALAENSWGALDQTVTYICEHFTLQQILKDLARTHGVRGVFVIREKDVGLSASRKSVYAVDVSLSTLRVRLQKAFPDYALKVSDFGLKVLLVYPKNLTEADSLELLQERHFPAGDFENVDNAVREVLGKLGGQAGRPVDSNQYFDRGGFRHLLDTKSEPLDRHVKLQDSNTTVLRRLAEVLEASEPAYVWLYLTDDDEASAVPPSGPSRLAWSVASSRRYDVSSAQELEDLIRASQKTPTVQFNDIRRQLTTSDLDIILNLYRSEERTALVTAMIISLIDKPECRFEDEAISIAAEMATNVRIAGTPTEILIDNAYSDEVVDFIDDLVTNSSVEWKAKVYHLFESCHMGIPESKREKWLDLLREGRAYEIKMRGQRWAGNVVKRAEAIAEITGDSSTITESRKQSQATAELVRERYSQYYASPEYVQAVAKRRRNWTEYRQKLLTDFRIDTTRDVGRFLPVRSVKGAQQE